MARKKVEECVITLTLFKAFLHLPLDLHAQKFQQGSNVQFQLLSGLNTAKMESNRVTVCKKTENFEHHEDCETWRLRCLHDLLLSPPFAYLVSMDHKGETTQPNHASGGRKHCRANLTLRGYLVIEFWGVRLCLD